MHALQLAAKAQRENYSECCIFQLCGAMNAVCFSCVLGKITLYITGYKGLQKIRAVNLVLAQN